MYHKTLSTYKRLTKDVTSALRSWVISNHCFDLFSFRILRKKKKKICSFFFFCFKLKCQTQSACSLTCALAAHVLSVSVIPPEPNWAASRMLQDTNSPKHDGLQAASNECTDTQWRLAWVCSVLAFFFTVAMRWLPVADYWGITDRSWLNICSLLQHFHWHYRLFFLSF